MTKKPVGRIVLSCPGGEYREGKEGYYCRIYGKICTENGKPDCSGCDDYRTMMGRRAKYGAGASPLEHIGED